MPNTVIRAWDRMAGKKQKNPCFLACSGVEDSDEKETNQGAHSLLGGGKSTKEHKAGQRVGSAKGCSFKSGDQAGFHGADEK